MKTRRKCGEDVSDTALSCPHRGASLTPDTLLGVAVMKLTGIVSGVVGVALLVFADQVDGSSPYLIWLFAGVLLVLGFVMFYRKWAERSDSERSQ